MERKLAAILAADVAGYSRLMGADEVGTLDALKAHLSELILPQVTEHGGRVVKTTGDGLLATFASEVGTWPALAQHGPFQFEEWKLSPGILRRARSNGNR